MSTIILLRLLMISDLATEDHSFSLCTAVVTFLVAFLMVSFRRTSRLVWVLLQGTLWLATWWYHEWPDMSHSWPCWPYPYFPSLQCCCACQYPSSSPNPHCWLLLCFGNAISTHCLLNLSQPNGCCSAMHTLQLCELHSCLSSRWQLFFTVFICAPPLVP
jgi:hypothetical protein